MPAPASLLALASLARQQRRLGLRLPLLARPDGTRPALQTDRAVGAAAARARARGRGGSGEGVHARRLLHAKGAPLHAGKPADRAGVALDEEGEDRKVLGQGVLVAEGVEERLGEEEEA